MCTNRRTIRNAYGKDLVVNCGHCPACKQERAIARANRCRAEHNSKKVCLFVTLTYRNCCCPYFDQRDLDLAPVVNTTMYDVHGDPFYVRYKSVPVYRDVTTKRVRRGRGKNYRFSFKDFRQRQQLSSIVLPYPASDNTSFRYLVNSHSTHVGVCYLPDIQNFFKNLRIYAHRHFDRNEVDFSFYQCSEYGPNTLRPHFHFLLYVDSSDVLHWKTAIAKTWPYDNHVLTGRNIQIAVDASSYVSSYVNCDASVPDVLANNPDFKPKHTYSKGFGMALECYSLPKIFEAYRRGDLTVDVPRIRKGAFVVDRVLLPKYVIHRYFPKVKGYCCLTPDALRGLVFRPESLAQYSRKLSYSAEDIKRNTVLLRNAVSRARSCGISLPDYADAYSNIWNLRSSQVLRNFYESIRSTSQYFFAYDNIKDYYSSDVLSPTLDDLMFYNPPDFHHIVDYNDFPDIVERTYELTQYYYLYSKDRHIRNEYYSNYGNLKNRV